ncbi:MAG: sulfite exporter TauE/SafE family protein [Sedimentisphaerales bacterium]|nr:sulfite exporter TauE/SafE family protein [Sedimentisphaerales bacterium]
MLEILELSLIGLAMGLFGGLLGLGGSTIMIPAMVVAFGENQHLYQSSAMICNFVVGISSLVPHWKSQALVKPVLGSMIPTAIVGILVGVAISNMPLFEGRNSVWLARCFGVFLIYVLIYNCWRMFQPARPTHENAVAHLPQSYRFWSAAIGVVTGIGAGVLGIGAGTITTPLQQVFLKLPIRRAMSNSAAIIVAISWVGAIYKNWTLPEHGIAVAESLKIALWVIPTGLIGGYIGGHLMHRLPRNVIRTLFLLILLLAIWNLLLVKPR